MAEAGQATGGVLTLSSPILPPLPPCRPAYCAAASCCCCPRYRTYRRLKKKKKCWSLFFVLLGCCCFCGQAHPRTEGIYSETSKSTSVHAEEERERDRRRRRRRRRKRRGGGGTEEVGVGKEGVIDWFLCESGREQIN